MGEVFSTLRKRDPHNQTGAILLLLCLTHTKYYIKLKFLKAYTMWNITAFTLSQLLNFETWQRPILCNSIAIWNGYRTATIDNIDKFRKNSGFTNPLQYALLDNAIHFLPVIILLYRVVKQKKYIRPQIAAFSLLAFVHFSYSQAGSLNVGKLYCEHDSASAWAATILGAGLTPLIVNGLIDKNYTKVIIATFIMNLPSMLKQLDIIKWPREPLFHVEKDLDQQNMIKLCSNCQENLCTNCLEKYTEKKRQKMKRVVSCVDAMEF